jgi:mxaJ protein
VSLLTAGITHRVVAAAAMLVGISVAKAANEDASQSQLRVCADPNNLPFSNEGQEGFENKLAELIAGKLHKSVTYTWWAQRRGYVRETLKARLCDVILGVPSQLDSLATTQPYYRTGYVFLSRTDRALDVTAITDARLRLLRVGVQLIGNNGFNTPPAHALGQLGIVNNVVGFPVYGDYRETDPARRIVDAVETGRVDIAAVWGPIAGYFAKISKMQLRLVPITDTERFAPLQFQFDISMGVRKEDQKLRSQLNDIIDRYRPDIDALLESYGVPLTSTVPAAEAAQLALPAE